MKSYGFDIPKSADKFDWAGHHAKTQEYLTRLNGCVRVLHLLNQTQAHWLRPSPASPPSPCLASVPVVCACALTWAQNINLAPPPNPLQLPLLIPLTSQLLLLTPSSS